MIIDYYLGSFKDESGFSINDYLSFDDKQIKQQRNYIPLAFPSVDVISGYNNPPTLTEEVVERFSKEEDLRQMVKKVINRYLKYLNTSDGWLNHADYDHILILRIIKFLSMIGMKEESIKVAEWCSNKSGASKKIKSSWLDAINYIPPWESKKEA